MFSLCVLCVMLYGESERERVRALKETKRKKIIIKNWNKQRVKLWKYVRAWCIRIVSIGARARLQFTNQQKAELMCLYVCAIHIPLPLPLSPLPLSPSPLTSNHFRSLFLFSFSSIFYFSLLRFGLAFPFSSDWLCNAVCPYSFLITT